MAGINHNIAAQLYEAQSCEEKFSILEKITEDSGFDGVLYTFIPKLSRLINLRPFFQFSNSYKKIVENYQLNNFSQNDFILRLLEEGISKPIDWWEVSRTLKLSKEEEHVNYVTRNQFGVIKGISFPTLNSDLGLAGVSIISFNPNYENKKIEEKTLTNLHKSIRIYHDHMMIHQDDRYQFILPLLNSLTAKQKIVIKHLISGQPMKNIEGFGVTERYGEKLLYELRKNFGDITKNELIYLLGLLNISEYFR